MSLQKAKVIDQKEYLKKYLSGDKEKKKKKKDKKLKKTAKVKIIDDDAYEDNGQVKSVFEPEGKSESSNCCPRTL